MHDTTVAQNKGTRSQPRKRCLDRITILRHSRNFIAKTWLADGTIRPYDEVKYLRREEVAVSSIEGLSMLLARLEGDRHACVIRGRYVGDELAAQRDGEDFKPGLVRRALDYFDDQPLHTMLVEVDEFVPLSADPALDPEGAITEYVFTQLPDCFHGVAHHWQLSNSAGHAKNAGKLKVHLWFWLATPYTSAQLKAWAEAAGVKLDRAVLNPVQIHYTATPTFEHGVEDPIAVRSGFNPGLVADEVELVIDDAMLAAAALGRKGRGQRLLEVAEGDPVAQRLAELGLVKSQRRDGGLNIECPFTDEHTGESGETATTYFLPHTNGHALGQFKCLHSHCSARRRGEFLARLGISEIVDEFSPIDDLSAEQEAEQLLIRARNAEKAQRVAETAIDKAMLRPDEYVDLAKAPVAASHRGESARTAAHLPSFPTAFPGPMLAAVEAALRAAPKPQPALTTLAVLIGMAAGCHGAYRLPSGMRANLYAIGVAGTGAGKDLPRKAGSAVASAAGAKVIGKPASGQGLEDALLSRVGLLTEIDEIGHMLAAGNSRNAPSYLIDLAGNLLKLYSMSATVYHTRVRAAAKTSAPPRAVHNPCLSLLGFATPHTLGESVRVANVADGLLGRMLFAFGDEGVVPRRPGVQFELPETCAAAAEAVRQAVGQLEFGDADGCIDIGIAEDAGARLDALLVELDRRAQNGSSAFEQALRARSYEKLERTAAVLAVWDAPLTPIVETRHVEWAANAVHAADAALVHFVTAHMHEGETQANAARVLDVVRRILSGDLKADRGAEEEAVSRGYAPRGLVLRRCKLAKQEMDRAIEHLQAADDLIVVAETTSAAKGGQRPATLYRLKGEG